MMTTRRKLAIATWSSPREGNIYGKLTVDAGPALKYIQHLRETTGEKVTITHLVGRAVAAALAKAPMLNGRIVLGRYEPFPTVDIAFLVSLEEGSDLAKAKVDNADQKSVAAIARELRERAERLRLKKDDEFEKSKGLLKALPTWVLRPLVWLTGFLSGSLGLSLPALGVTPFPFGSCIITSVGMFGLDEAFAPPTPFARVPVYVLVGAVRERPVAVNGQVVIQPQLTLCCTLDHRFIDGHHAGTLAKVVRDVLENPSQLDGQPDAGAPKPLPA